MKNVDRSEIIYSDNLLEELTKDHMEWEECWKDLEVFDRYMSTKTENEDNNMENSISDSFNKAPKISITTSFSYKIFDLINGRSLEDFNKSEYNIQGLNTMPDFVKYAALVEFFESKYIGIHVKSTPNYSFGQTCLYTPGVEFRYTYRYENFDYIPREEAMLKAIEKACEYYNDVKLYTKAINNEPQ